MKALRTAPRGLGRPAYAAWAVLLFGVPYALEALLARRPASAWAPAVIATVPLALTILQTVAILWLTLRRLSAASLPIWLGCFALIPGVRAFVVVLCATAPTLGAARSGGGDGPGDPPSTQNTLALLAAVAGTGVGAGALFAIWWCLRIFPGLVSWIARGGVPVWYGVLASGPLMGGFTTALVLSRLEPTPTYGRVACVAAAATAASCLALFPPSSRPLDFIAIVGGATGVSVVAAAAGRALARRVPRANRDLGASVSK